MYLDIYLILNSMYGLGLDSTRIISSTVFNFEQTRKGKHHIASHRHNTNEKGRKGRGRVGGGGTTVSEKKKT